jgi:hypothetical protein
MPRDSEKSLLWETDGKSQKSRRNKITIVSLLLEKHGFYSAQGLPRLLLAFIAKEEGLCSQEIGDYCHHPSPALDQINSPLGNWMSLTPLCLSHPFPHPLAEHIASLLKRACV